MKDAQKVLPSAQRMHSNAPMHRCDVQMVLVNTTLYSVVPSRHVTKMFQFCVGTDPVLHMDPNVLILNNAHQKV